METMQYHKWIDFLGQCLFLQLSGVIEQICIHKEMSEVFSVGLINLLDTSLSNRFLFFFKFFRNIHEYANEIIFILDHRMKVLVKMYH